MDGDFWRQKWRDNAIAFHRADANPLLIRHFPALGLSPGARVFVPLCGKTLDIHWLLGEGFGVVGAELVETAVEQLFAELGVEPRVERAGGLSRYHADGIDIFAGDVFELGREALGRVDAAWDRAALVALTEDVRPGYAAHVATITGGAPQLLVTYVYDKALASGPPFSVDDEEVSALYAGTYAVELLESVDVGGGLKGKCPATEKIWMAR